MTPYAYPFVIRATVDADQQLHMQFDDDHQRWPWLALPGHHPAWAGKFSFFVGMACGEQLLHTRESAAAVTEVNWQLTQRHDPYFTPAGGIASAVQEESRLLMRATIMDASGAPAVQMASRAVVFGQRDYGGWRQKMKQALNHMRSQDFRFADAASVGLGSAVECFVSPLHEGRNGLACDALITAQSGFTPGHPWHTGSGDHVNASQQLDIAWQAAHLIGRAQGWWSAGHALICVAGEARFRHYIELAVPIRIRLTGWRPLDDGWQVSFALQQGDRACANISLRIALRDQLLNPDIAPKHP